MRTRQYFQMVMMSIFVCTAVVMCFPMLALAQVDGGWSVWGWTPCSKGCNAEGVRYYIRICNNPAPQAGGRECTRKDGTQTTPSDRTEVDRTIDYGRGYVVCNKQACSGPAETIAPSVPQNVRATVLSDTKIRLTWDSSIDNIGVVKYRIYDNRTTFQIGVSDHYYTPENYQLNQYTIAYLTPGATYSFSITALDDRGNESAPSAPIQVTTLPYQQPASVINPQTDITYLGAFRLPTGSGVSRWGYGGDGLTYYPQGDPNGPDDKYPGSLFGFGHIYEMAVSEISIPEPVISPNKSLNDLNQATTLQPFAKVDTFAHKHLTQPVGDLAYLPKQGNQSSDKLYYIFGSDYNWDKIPSHSASDLTLASPNTAGWWYVGSAKGDPRYYGTIFYLFEIPQDWANKYTGGRRLLTGGTRSGAYNGFGTAMYAIGPWLDGHPFPPFEGELSYQTLLEYGQVMTVNTQDNRNPIDVLHGGAWITSGNQSAILLVGNKGFGEFSYDGGYVTTLSRPVFMFFNPTDLEDVVTGKKKSYEPQAYALLDVGKYMFRDSPDIRGCAYDRQRGFLYVWEVNNEDPIIHVWKIGQGETPKYPLTVSKTGTGTGVISSDSGAISCGSTCTAELYNGTSVILTATPDNGSIFKGWNGACTGTGTCQVTMTAAMTVSAAFERLPVGTVSALKQQHSATNRGDDPNQFAVYRGDTISYDITLTNLFDQAVSIMITDALSTLVDYVAGTFRINGQTVANDEQYVIDDLLGYEAGLLAQGASLWLSFDVLVNEISPTNEPIENSALISASYLGTPILALRSNQVSAMLIEESGNSPVPEPTTIIFMSIGLCAMAVLIRKRSLHKS